MESGKSYHLYTHANGFENLFNTDENYRYFLQRYEYFIPSVADTFAYCLMPNHIHFLIRIKTEEQIISTFGKFQTFQKLEARVSKQFANLFSSYTQAFNKMYVRNGSLFIPNFKRKEITDDSYFTQLIHYIHANPVHHGFVKNLADWRWSSYPLLLSENPSLLMREEVINWFGNKTEFEQFHQQAIELRIKTKIDLTINSPKV